MAILLLMMTGITQLSAQQIEANYRHLKSIDSDGEKKVLLQQLTKETVNQLKNGNGQLSLSDSSVLRQIQSPDKKIMVYYYIASFKNQSRQLEMFLSYTRNNKLCVSSFSTEVTASQTSKNDHSLLNYSAEINEYTIDNQTFYRFALKDDHGNLIAPMTDLLLKGMFEEMALATNDASKLAINQEILKRFSILWQSPSMKNDMFGGFNRMSVVTSEDKTVKIFTWNTELANFNHLFWGAITVVKANGELHSELLVDKTEEIKTAERSSLSSKKWYGAIYFDLIENEYKKQKYYTLLGFKGNTEFTKLKVVDVMTIAPNGEVKFYSPILNKGPGYVPRLVFEYSLQANMMLKYDKLHKMIVMDNLAPSSAAFKDNFMHYGPDFSYNGLKFEKGKWVFYPDIDLRNPKTK